MRFLRIILVAALLLTVIAPAALAANNPSDVPPSHWAYQAVKLMIDKGYLQLYQDQSFQGEKPIDRYTLAVVTAKLLNELASGRVGGTKEDVELLRKLTNEYWNELVAINTKGDQSSRKLENLTKQEQIFREDLTQTIAVVQNLTAEQILIQKEVKQILTELQNISTQIKRLEEENASLRADLAKLKAETEEAQSKNKLYIMAAIVLGLVGAAK